MENKKGQAAMEFLMTYGWAILAAIVVIAVLAIYFRPSQLVSNSGVVSAPFNLVSQQVLNAGCAGNDCVKLELKNNGGTKAVVSEITVTTSGATPATCTFDGGAGYAFEAGAQHVFEVDCGAVSVFALDDSVSGDVKITYTSGSATLPQTSSGNIAGKAQ